MSEMSEMKMTKERQHELLIKFTGFISTLDGIRKNPIFEDVKEVLEAIGLDERVTTTK